MEIPASINSLRPRARSALLWLGVTAAFAGYGIFGTPARTDWGWMGSTAGDAAARALFYGAWGAGVATCVVAASWVFGRIRSDAVSKAYALAFLVGSALGGTLTTYLILLVGRTLAPSAFLEWHHDLGNYTSSTALIACAILFFSGGYVLLSGTRLNP